MKPELQHDIHRHFDDEVSSAVHAVTSAEGSRLCYGSVSLFVCKVSQKL